jgi:hypothetical protein
MFKNFGAMKSLFKNSQKYFSANYDYDLCVIGGGPAGK